MSASGLGESDLSGADDASVVIDTTGSEFPTDIVGIVDSIPPDDPADATGQIGYPFAAACSAQDATTLLCSVTKDPDAPDSAGYQVYAASASYAASTDPQDATPGESFTVHLPAAASDWDVYVRASWQSGGSCELDCGNTAESDLGETDVGDVVIDTTGSVFPTPILGAADPGPIDVAGPTGDVGPTGADGTTGADGQDSQPLDDSGLAVGNRSLKSTCCSSASLEGTHAQIAQIEKPKPDKFSCQIFSSVVEGLDSDVQLEAGLARCGSIAGGLDDPNPGHLACVEDTETFRFVETTTASKTVNCYDYGGNAVGEYHWYALKESSTQAGTWKADIDGVVKNTLSGFDSNFWVREWAEHTPDHGCSPPKDWSAKGEFKNWAWWDGSSWISVGSTPFSQSRTACTDYGNNVTRDDPWTLGQYQSSGSWWTVQR